MTPRREGPATVLLLLLAALTAHEPTGAGAMAAHAIGNLRR